MTKEISICLNRACETIDAKIALSPLLKGVSLEEFNNTYSQQQKINVLKLAIKNKYYPALQLLINLDKTEKELLAELMETAVNSDDGDAIKILIEAGANPNSLIEIAYYDTIGRVTLLMRAVQKNCFSALDALIEGGANLETRCNVYDRDLTPLMKAAIDENMVAIVKLVKAGADIEALNDHDETALMLATTLGFLKSVRKLIELGAKLTTKNRAGETIVAKLNPTRGYYNQDATDCRQAMKTLFDGSSPTQRKKIFNQKINGKRPIEQAIDMRNNYKVFTLLEEGDDLPVENQAYAKIIIDQCKELNFKEKLLYIYKLHKDFEACTLQALAAREVHKASQMKILPPINDLPLPDDLKVLCQDEQGFQYLEQRPFCVKSKTTAKFLAEIFEANENSEPEAKRMRII